MIANEIVDKSPIDTLDIEEFTQGISCKGPFIWAILFESNGAYIEGRKTSLLVPHSVHQREKYKNFVAYVVYMGDECYKAENGTPKKQWCKVGDWIVLPRHEGVQMTYKGYPMIIIYDDRVFGSVSNPELFYKE